MKLWLHIGTPKTGTTSLQQWSAAHRDDLARHGVLYPTSPGTINHRKLFMTALPPDQPITPFGPERDGARTRLPPSRSKFVAELAEELQAATDAGMGTCLMSNEHLWSRLAQPRYGDAIATLHDMLTPLFDDIGVAVHLRPQIDLIRSNASQRARSHLMVTRDHLTRSSVGPGNTFFDYNATVGRWEDVFGRDVVTTIPFKRQPDTLAATLESLGLDPREWPMPQRQNTALGWLHMAVTNAVLLADVPMPDLADLPETSPLQIGEEIAREVQSRFAESNRQLVGRRHELQHDDLEPRWSKYDGPPNIDRIEGTGAVLARLMTTIREEGGKTSVGRSVDLEPSRTSRHGSGRPVEALQREVEALRDSTSWRVMRPLRQLSRLLSRRHR